MHPPKSNIPPARRGNSRSGRGTGRNGDAAPRSSRSDLSLIFERIIQRLISSEDARRFDGLAKGRSQFAGDVDSDPAPSLSENRDSVRTARPCFPRWKRLIDVSCVLLTLPCWLPLMAVVMLWIKITSSGPIFYRQERVGFRRNRFMLFKFRTMRVHSETRTHEEYFAYLMQADCPMEKLDAQGDSRLIVCGRFLRASGLDELPQIFNVLQGEMSLVGPRPCLTGEFQRYAPWQQERFNAPPGLTGYWQVNGKNKTTFSEMISMDIFYARNMSVWLDLEIMLKTVPTLILQTLESGKVDRRRTVRQVEPAAEVGRNGAKTL